MKQSNFKTEARANRTLFAETGITNVVVLTNHLLFIQELQTAIMLIVEINKSELVSITPAKDE